MSADWLAWHEAYDSPESPLQGRLAEVRRSVRIALESVGSPAQLLSLCAGDGRDVIPALVELGPAFCAATLIELSPELSDRARAIAAAARLDLVVVTGDAADPGILTSVGPADVLLLCGIFGNISDHDVANTIRHTGRLVRRGGYVLWTRHRKAPDLTPDIRGTFAECGFEEVGFVSPGPAAWSVGVHRNVDAVAADITAPLFTFIR